VLSYQGAIWRLPIEGGTMKRLADRGAQIASVDMDLRNFVTFEAQFPDDAVWNEAGKPLVPAGHGPEGLLVLPRRQDARFCT
jgi:hypothetical protein